MKLAPPITLSLQKEPENTGSVHLFGWELDKENAAIKIAANKGCSITTPFPEMADYKEVMLDIVANPPFKIGQCYVQTHDPEFIEQGIIEISTKTKGGTTASSKMLLCDFISLFQHQHDVVVIDREFWIDPTVEVIVQNLRKEAVIRFYPIFKQTIDELERDFKMPAENDIKTNLSLNDVKKGCGSWIMLKNKTDREQKVELTLKNKESCGQSEIGQPLLWMYVLQKSNKNVELVESMPAFSKRSDRTFTLYSDRLCLHKIYSCSPKQVAQPIGILDKAHEQITIRLSPYQNSDKIIKVDYDLAPLITDAMPGTRLLELTILPSASMVVFFSGKD
jgi:hypothetical protein